jgi:hypothetical protein
LSKRGPLGMLQKLLDGLLREVSRHLAVDEGEHMLRMSMRAGPRGGGRYVFDATAFDGELHLSFFIGLHQLDDDAQLVIPYSLGDAIDVVAHMQAPQLGHLEQGLSTLNWDGGAYAIITQCSDLPQQDFGIGGFKFLAKPGFSHVADIYLFANGR